MIHARPIEQHTYARQNKPVITGLGSSPAHHNLLGPGSGVMSYQRAVRRTRGLKMLLWQVQR